MTQFKRPEGSRSVRGRRKTSRGKPAEEKESSSETAQAEPAKQEVERPLEEIVRDMSNVQLRQAMKPWSEMMTLNGNLVSTDTRLKYMAYKAELMSRPTRKKKRRE